MAFKVTPWEVTGKVDYDKLRKNFGAKPIDQKLKDKIKKNAGNLHHFLSRDFFFSHRDFDLILKDYEKDKGFFLYTGRAPGGGDMTLGHLVPFVFTKWLQEIFDVNLYIQIPDEEKFLHKQNLSWETVQEKTKTDLEHIASLGFNQDKTFLFQNSEYIKNMYPMLMKTAKKITHSTMKAVFGFKDSTNIGMSFYPSIQMVPTFFE
ncbi:MAG: tryptophan--tRNA ligase, partial [Candidatus Aenigmatarchaeota archaeon]